MAVPHPLPHRDDIGHHALMLLIAPEHVALAPVADLHLVGDAHATACSDGVVDRREVSLRHFDRARVAVAGLGNESPDGPSLCCETLDLGDRVSGIGGARVRSAMPAA